jgi:hypothetical protein
MGWTGEEAQPGANPTTYQEAIFDDFWQIFSKNFASFNKNQCDDPIFA